MLDAAAWITVTQVNAELPGIAATVCLAAPQVASLNRSRGLNDLGSGRTKQRANSTTLGYTGVLATALCIAFLAPATVNVALAIPPAIWAVAADGLFGWSAVILAAASAMAIQWRRGISQRGVGLLAVSIVCS